MNDENEEENAQRKNKPEIEIASASVCCRIVQSDAEETPQLTAGGALLMC